MRQTKLHIKQLPPAATCVCCKCGDNMEGTWESIDTNYDPMYVIVATVFHCNICGEDTEVIRKCTEEGEVIEREERHYFFG